MSLSEKWADTDFQIKYHKLGVKFWLANFAVITTVFFAAPPIWQKISILYVVWLSLYANFATEYGAQAAAEASKAAEEGDHDVSDEG